MLQRLRTPVRIILPVWLIVKLIGALIAFFSQGAVDLTFLNPGIELGFQSLVFMKNTAAGLGVFVGIVTVSAVGFPLSFLVIPDNRTQNIAGFFAYAVVLLLDMVSAVILGFKDGIFIISLALSLLMTACLLLYGRLYLLKPHDEAVVRDSKDAENNP